MEGWLAGVFAVFGAVDVYLNDCQTSCFAYSEATSRVHVQAGATEFNNRWIGQEVLLGYDLGRKYGPFQPTVATSFTDLGDAWIGAGLKWNTQHLFDGPVFFESYAMPGLYAAGDGSDIGGFIQFRGSIGFGYEFENGVQALIAYDHRSNAHIWETNPGLETFHLRVSFPLD